MADDRFKAIPGSGLSDEAQAAHARAVMDGLVSLFPPGTVITLLTSFPEGTPGVVEKVPGGRTNYTSNGHRDDMAESMIEMLKRWGKI